MARIEQSVWIDKAPDVVWNVVRDVEQFPSIMADLQSVRILERSEDGLRTTTEWVGLVREFNMKVVWTEEDVWDPAEMTCRFTMIKGDMQSMTGLWQFTAENGGTRFSSTMDYEYNVPMLGALVKNLIHKKLEQNVQMILDGVKRLSEGT